MGWNPLGMTIARSTRTERNSSQQHEQQLHI
jgi:hypothetical protein